MDEKKLNELGHQLTLDEWSFIRDDIKRRLSESASNFVGIGFRLKQLKETGMFDGCKDIFEFAQREYGMSKSGVYRFMAINTKYSEGGNSLLLRDEFKNFSVSKLDEMLALPDSEIEMVTEDTTISQIRELKEFNKQETELTEQVNNSADEEQAEQKDAENAAAGIEKAQETQDEAQEEAHGAAGSEETNGAAGQTETVNETAVSIEKKSTFPTSGNPLADCIIDFFKDKEEMLNETLKYIRDDDMTDETVKKIAGIINPSGNTSHKYKKVFIFLYDSDTGIKYKILGNNDIVKRSWHELIGIIADIYGEEVLSADNPYRAYYGMTQKEIPDVGKNANPIEEKSAFADSDTEKTAEKQEIPKEESVFIESESAFADSEVEKSEEKTEEEDNEPDSDERRLNHRLSDLANVCGQVRVEKASMSQLEYLAMTMDMALRQLKTYIEIKKEENE